MLHYKAHSKKIYHVLPIYNLKEIAKSLRIMDKTQEESGRVVTVLLSSLVLLLSMAVKTNRMLHYEACSMKIYHVLPIYNLRQIA